MKGKYLINTDSYFIAPDGREYKAVYGEVEILNDTFLGVKTNARSANWFAKVGTEENHVIIAGCQIHYATKTTKEVNRGKGMGWDEKGVESSLPCRIYFAE
ncbi:hypothetical protein Phi19:1_gp075 [Cellulophaga phage phi19:1]|uniref:Uncharacterized protein n=1 Tax=Cellulophaga phage phi19:1 TaxID=1327970 RepID=R9ZXV8_9CAUD|nr:hypothetical protein Phi19:1_gp075 [Cellulophaga phage phi19:1]AGO47365.1 hypothetical protein Phi19:1_gp075 [Cellulophaga phage phi19:1]